ncbi:Zinc finger C2HC domain-containing protein 1C, partial [Clydaea vesicula]
MLTEESSVKKLCIVCGDSFGKSFLPSHYRNCVRKYIGKPSKLQPLLTKSLDSVAQTLQQTKKNSVTPPIQQNKNKQYSSNLELDKKNEVFNSQKNKQKNDYLEESFENNNSNKPKNLVIPPITKSNYLNSESESHYEKDRYDSKKVLDSPPPHVQKKVNISEKQKKQNKFDESDDNDEEFKVFNSKQPPKDAVKKNFNQDVGNFNPKNKKTFVIMEKKSLNSSNNNNNFKNHKEDISDEEYNNSRELEEETKFSNKQNKKDQIKSNPHNAKASRYVVDSADELDEDKIFNKGNKAKVNINFEDEALPVNKNKSKFQPQLEEEEIPIKKNNKSNFDQEEKQEDVDEEFKRFSEVALKLPCQICNRTFAAQDRLDKHIIACEKSRAKQRKAFDSTKNRVQGTELEAYVVGNKKKKDEVVVKKSNWRAKREGFLKQIRSVKGSEAGGTVEVEQNPDYVVCEYCERKFNETAAERHIPICKESKRKAEMRGQSKKGGFIPTEKDEERRK